MQLVEELPECRRQVNLVQLALPRPLHLSHLGGRNIGIGAISLASEQLVKDAKALKVG